MYADYPISPTLFHWESQSTTSVGSPTGQRYVNGTSTVLLFVRHEQKDEFGTSPYLFLGPADHVSHEGDRPISFTWRLDTPHAGRLPERRVAYGAVNRPLGLEANTGTDSDVRPLSVPHSVGISR